MEARVYSVEDSLQEHLDKRKADALYRTLQVQEGLIDFCSNDYLSFARSEKIRKRAEQQAMLFPIVNGSTGSRSISGNTAYAEELEKSIAKFHGAKAGLIFNSGYDANIGLFSCVTRKEDTIICDELIHASIIDGCRLSYAKRLRFRHNDAEDLERKLKEAKGNVFVAVESVYSMDGDSAPLTEIAELCSRFNANLIVDEAHATGIFGEKGKGLVHHFHLEDLVFARIHTFGKALGCHGAIVLGSEVLRDYLINYSRSFIFTTALPIHSLAAIRAAYEELESEDFKNESLHEMAKYFRNNFLPLEDIFLTSSISPIQSVILPGNERAKSVSQELQINGFDVRAILSPSVPQGKERLRISLHLHNTNEQVKNLINVLQQILEG